MLNDQPTGGPAVEEGTTVTEVLERYAAEGFVSSYSTVAGARLRCDTCGNEVEAASTTLHSMRRMEGASDPADMLAIAAVICPSCSARGTIVLGFGPAASDEDGDVLLALRDRRGSGDLPRDAAPGEAADASPGATTVTKPGAPSAPPGEGSNHLVAVFADRARALDVRRSLLDRGFRETDLRLDDADDRVSSLEAEMQSEMSEGLVSPLPLVTTNRGMRGFAATAALGVVVALALAVPLAFIDIGLAYWGRYIIIAAFLILLAGTIALVIGPGMGVNRPDEAMAAERGVTLQAPNTDAARRALLAGRPIRLDEVDATGLPVQAIATGPGEGDGAVSGGLVENLGTDDYSPPEPPSTR